MRPSIQMGVSGYNLKVRESSKYNENEDKEEVLYSLPVKSHMKKVQQNDTDQTDEKQTTTPRVKANRQSLPFSDIPEERTCDKIDEMFDFVEVPTGDFEDKTLERTVDGYAEIKSQSSPAKKIMNPLDLSTNTYQEIEFDKDVSEYIVFYHSQSRRITNCYVHFFRLLLMSNTSKEMVLPSVLRPLDHNSLVLLHL